MRRKRIKAPEVFTGKAWKGLVLFGAVMLALTLLSRAAAHVTTPQVVTENPARGALEYKLRASGIVKENQVFAVTVLPGIRVARISVNAGDSVKAGDTLFTLDIEDLKEQILLKKQEIEKIDLGIRDIEERKAQLQSEKETEQARAAEDYNQAAQAGDKAVEQAYEDMEEAENRLAEFQNSCSVREEESQDDAQQEQELADARQEQELADAQQEQALADACRQAQNAYENAVDERDKSLTNAERKIEDSVKDEAPDSSGEVSGIDRQVLALELEKMEALQGQEGVVSSSVDGRIMDIAVETGNDTMDGKCMSIADLSLGSRFVAQISREEQKWIDKGDNVVINPGSGKKKAEGLKVESIRENEKEEDMLDVTVVIPDNRLEIGTTAEMEADKKSSEYSCTVPIEALRSENRAYCVLIAEETKTVLGTELTARKVDVEVLEKNDKLAALKEGALSLDAEVIVESGKPVKEGDRICLKENQEQ